MCMVQTDAVTGARDLAYRYSPSSSEIMGRTAVERLPVPSLRVPAKQHAAERSCAALLQ